LYTLVRTIDEANINDYHPAVMLGWRANNDIQLVSEKSYVLNRYITNYMTKDEKGWSSGRYMQVDEMQSITSKARSLINQFTASREKGILEAAMRCIGRPYIDSTFTVEDISLGPSNQRSRKLRHPSIIKKLPDDSTDLFETGFLDYYAARPREMSTMSVYEVLQNFTYKNFKNKEEWEADKLKDHTGKRAGAPGRPRNERFYFDLTRQDGTVQYKAFVRRDKPVVVSPNYMPLGNDDEQRSRFMFNMLQLYTPWRNEMNIMPALYTTMEMKLNYFKQKMNESAALHASDQRKRMLQSNLERADKWLEEAEQERIDQAADEDITLDEHDQAKRDKREKELAEATSVKLNEFQFKTSAEYFERMNAEQKAIFNRAIDSIKTWQENGAVFDETKPGIIPLRLFVSGVAGTGKSFLIQALSLGVDELYAQRDDQGQFKDSCVVRMGPTGVCASSINGATIHSVLKISIQKKQGEMEQSDLADHDVLAMREVFKSKKLWLIDEISMVSNVTFAKVDHRLNQVYRTFPQSEWPDNCTSFGAQNVIIFGDMLQLAPVVTGDDVEPGTSAFVFEKASKRRAKRVFGHQALKMLFNQFQYMELIQQMRQKGDSSFQNLLNNVRLGSLRKDEYDLLMQRQIDMIEKEATPAHYRELAEHFDQLFQENKSTVCLFPRRDDVAQFNQAMIAKLKLKPVVVPAIDRLDGAAKKVQVKKRQTKKAKRFSNKSLLDSNQTGGLEQDLLLAENARVMLRRNTDAHKKLVNGSLGTIVKLKYARGILDAVDIKFDHLDEVTRYRE